MCEEMVAVTDSLSKLCSSLEVGLLSGPDAKAFARGFGKLRRLASAAEARCAARVAETDAYLHDGHKTPERWFAGSSGTSVGEAASVLATASQLDGLAEIAGAFDSGELSLAQAGEIVPVAVLDPSGQSELLDAARSRDLVGLKRFCERKRSEHRSQEEEAERLERLHRTRSVRHWTDADGAFWLRARLAPDAGAEVLASLSAVADRAYGEARRSGRNEAPEAYLADALYDLVTSGGAGRSGPRTRAEVRIDLAALRRGHAGPGETCEIKGVGPVSVKVARALMGDAILDAFVTSGTDVASLCHLGRTIPTNLKRAVEQRDPHCVVPGCGSVWNLEVDHCKIPFAEGGRATIDNLARLCRFHHRMKTHRGYRLAGSPGAWVWIHPDGTEHRDPLADRKPDTTDHDAAGEQVDPGATGPPPSGPPADRTRPSGPPDQPGACERPDPGATGPPGPPGEPTLFGDGRVA